MIKPLLRKCLNIRTEIIFVLTFICFCIPVFVHAAFITNSVTIIVATECNDGIDNDADGAIDLLDSGCDDIFDDQEEKIVVTNTGGGGSGGGGGINYAYPTITFVQTIFQTDALEFYWTARSFKGAAVSCSLSYNNVNTGDYFEYAEHTNEIDFVEVLPRTAMGGEYDVHISCVDAVRGESTLDLTITFPAKTVEEVSENRITSTTVIEEAVPDVINDYVQNVENLDLSYENLAEQYIRLNWENTHEQAVEFVIIRNLDAPLFTISDAVELWIFESEIDTTVFDDVEEIYYYTIFAKDKNNEVIDSSYVKVIPNNITEENIQLIDEAHSELDKTNNDVVEIEEENGLSVRKLKTQDFESLYAGTFFLEGTTVEIRFEHNTRLKHAAVRFYLSDIEFGTTLVCENTICVGSLTIPMLNLPESQKKVLGIFESVNIDSEPFVQLEFLDVSTKKEGKYTEAVLKIEATTFDGDSIDQMYPVFVERQGIIYDIRDKAVLRNKHLEVIVFNSDGVPVSSGYVPNGEYRVVVTFRGDMIHEETVVVEHGIFAPDIFVLREIRVPISVLRLTSDWYKYIIVTIPVLLFLWWFIWKRRRKIYCHFSELITDDLQIEIFETKKDAWKSVDIHWRDKNNIHFYTHIHIDRVRISAQNKQVTIPIELSRRKYKYRINDIIVR